MKFQREKASLVLTEVRPLLEMHWAEIAAYKDIPLEPDLEAYARIDESGGLRVFTARDEANTLIGYNIFFVHRNLHYKSSLQANQDILYIHPDKRGFGMRFILWCDKELKTEGVQVVYHHVKAKHDFGPMLERMGYNLVDKIYAKRLD